MSNSEADRLPPISCESDGWPFTANPALFEARRAVGQLARTIASTSPTRGSPAAAVVAYMFAADAILTALHDQVLPELVAEARALDIPWAKIGQVLGVGDTAAQKRFGKKQDLRSGTVNVETLVARATSDLALKDPYSGGFEWLEAEAMEGLGDTTPIDRIQYMFALIREAHVSFKQARDELNLSPSERDHNRLASVLPVVLGKITLSAKTLLPDSAQWAAVTDWADQPTGPDSAHYYAPATYLFYAMRQIVLAGFFSTEAEALDREADFDEYVDLSLLAIESLEVAMRVAMRPDVQSALTHASEAT